jgi:hypothetical protein
VVANALLKCIIEPRFDFDLRLVTTNPRVGQPHNRTCNVDLFFMEANEPLTKKYAARKGGVEKTPYPFVWEFTSHRKAVNSLTQFEQQLRSHAARGHCLLKGPIHRDLVKESRAGSTVTNDPTDWVCLDFDGMDASSVHTALVLLGLGDVSYIVQHSASSLLFDKHLRAHVFMLLDKPATAPLLKQWLIHINHQCKELRDGMKLTKTGNAISWALDISACQNDKLIYIAPPQLDGIADPYPGGKGRIALVKRKLDRLVIPGGFSTEKNKAATAKRLGELRDAEGLPKRTFKYKVHGSTEILVKPDSSMITELKTERGFTYFNLNGGDSWAYYHPENNPEFIFNFKGEPVYLTKELLPDYWEQLTNNATKTNSNGLTYLAFCDRRTSVYWRGTYDLANDQLEINAAKNETQLRHFAKQHGMPLGDFIPEWDLVFDPQDSVRVDIQNRVVNTFQPSDFMKLQNLKTVSKIPPTIFKVMNHAVGGDPDILEHFVNWLAYIVQKRDRTRTSWVLHGTQGTGKGLITTNVLRPLLGPSNTVMKRMEELSEQFNPYMRAALLIVVDEVQTSALMNEEGVMAKLRNFITEEFVPVRMMHATSVEYRNFTNWIFNSNKPDPVSIPKGDRRTNVAKYQPVPLKDANVLTPRELENIEALLASELQSFFSYLLFYPLDVVKANTPIETVDRTIMQNISESSVDTVSSALLDGHFEFLMDQLPSGHNYADNSMSAIKLDNYKHVLVALLARTNPKTGKCNISREELRVLYEFIVGNMPSTPNKFTSLLKHHRIHIEKVWINNATASGIATTWVDLNPFPAWLATLQPKLPANVVPMKKKAVIK